jgi:hypothetical protein
LNVVHIILNDVQYTMTIKLHHRAPLFGIGVALAAVCAARIGHGCDYKLARVGDFHTVVQGGAWADLGVAVVGFLLGFVICRQVVTTHPPAPWQSIGLALTTSMAIGHLILVATALAFAAKGPLPQWGGTFGLSLMVAWPYFFFTAGLPLVGLMSAWTMIWRFLCIEEADQRPTSPGAAE